MSCKLIFDSEWMDDQRRVTPLVEELNKHLPDDIVVFAASKLTKTFHAKTACSW